MEMKVRKKPLLRRNQSMGFALKQWNKVAPEYKLAQTQRKDQQRLDKVKKVIRAMEKAGIDWRDKDVWRAAFRKIGQAKVELEAQHGNADFRVTFDWAVCLRNTAPLIGLQE